MFAKTKSPSVVCSCIRFVMASCGMTLDMKDELLLTMLVLGFLRFALSLPIAGVSKALSSPKTGVLAADALVGWAARPSLLVSCELLDSFSLSFMMDVARLDLVLPEVAMLYMGGGLRGFIHERESLRPVVGGRGAVAKGFGLAVWCSEGCGGGVAR